MGGVGGRGIGGIWKCEGMEGGVGADEGVGGDTGVRGLDRKPSGVWDGEGVGGVSVGVDVRSDVLSTTGVGSGG